jgi:hypothetical protein
VKTAKQREEDFRRELAELLERHGAEIDVTDDGRPFGMQSGVCLVTMGGQYDEDGKTVAEYTEFQL